MGHQDDRVDHALLVQECLEVQVLPVLDGKIVKLDLIKVSFGVVHFVEVLPGVHVWEVVLQIVFGEFESFVINDWQNIVLMDR